MTAEKLNPLAHQPPARTDFPAASEVEWEHAAPEARATHEQRIDALLKLRNARNANREHEA